MLNILKLVAVLAAVGIIILATLTPDGLAWNQPLAWIGIAAIGLGLLHAHRDPPVPADTGVSP